MSDETGEVEKEMLKMNYMANQECAEFYFQHKLNHKLMSPKNPLCAVSTQTRPCVWDGGAALVTRQSWGYWTLLGFSVRGPGCGAPTRFLYIHDYLQWIDEIISYVPHTLREEDQALIFRRVSPIKLIMYNAKLQIPKEIGACDRTTRGAVLYKDNSELLVNKNFAQGFFFMSMAQVAQVNCATIVLDVSSRTNAAVWIEHHCHRDYTGDRQGAYFKDVRPRDCFVYFKSVTFIEFRFYFSFKATLEVTLFGKEELPKFIPNPYPVTESTYNWLPTYSYLRDKWFVPGTSWWWNM
ncbi:uncharacterized protein LOC113404339 [Vanessa tameamea]|uniref:Uncharacterized protein LOC113404339 n=1 Tax=Vanessa tameamea TaxID=334116 RepID=A0A8B8IWM8_VANTA|nr:uncharacterized protein LOC113404339 [Vanessa tameamea]